MGLKSDVKTLLGGKSMPSWRFESCSAVDQGCPLITVTLISIDVPYDYKKPSEVLLSSGGK